ncbi:MAG TPA: hypothetical protein VHG92_10175 [Afifellaceae bacterium]|nr:hypothetical protein [Afifellaceae bacterium]
MFTAFVAICVLSIPVESCSRLTAVDWIVAPQRQSSAVGCLIHGQRYAAQSRLVTEGTYLKVFCRSPGGRPSVAAK